MRIYLISLGAGLLAGLVYGLLGVRSPAPPVIALVGLLGILAGEQIVPMIKRISAGQGLVQFVRTECREHVLGRLPGDQRGR
jgi:XapX domain-containing protein